MASFLPSKLSAVAAAMSNPFDDHRQIPPRYSVETTIEDEVGNYERELGHILKESLQSTQRSAQHLENSEQLATFTAQELLTQREKIERTDKHLDEIHVTTQETQKNINKLKSFFGGFFKNKFFSRSKSKPKPTAPPSSPTLALEAKLNNHGSDSGQATTFDGPSLGPSLCATSRDAIKGTEFEDIDNQIDEGLDLISTRLRILRDLGKYMGNEVEDQNQMLDRIQHKANRNDAAVRKQDAQMKKLLGCKNVEAPEDTSAFGNGK
uniref:t-SNARE coiled-coil homology domain-containing protein n=1 Tax=Panagrellus redivivus TaxID=6233 RepID=A0A7E4W8W5_PANRE